MTIKVKYFAFFKDLVGRDEDIIEVEQDNFDVWDLINLLSERYGNTFRNTLMNLETKQLKEGCILLLNDMKGHLDQRLKDGDAISFLPVLAGG